MYIVHEPQLFLIYMQSTSDAPLSPESENLNISLWLFGFPSMYIVYDVIEI